MPILFEILGIAGIAISMLAYVPQVVHLAREHCSAGISRRAWAMWLASGLLIGALAIHRRDPVFILLQISNLTSTALILFLSWRYRGMVCEAHAPPRPAAQPPATAGLARSMRNPAQQGHGRGHGRGTERHGPAFAPARVRSETPEDVPSAPWAGYGLPQPLRDPE
jgi:uncharacterized protein with PQ loop repeat